MRSDLTWPARNRYFTAFRLSVAYPFPTALTVPVLQSRFLLFPYSSLSVGKLIKSCQCCLSYNISRIRLAALLFFPSISSTSSLFPLFCTLKCALGNLLCYSVCMYCLSLVLTILFVNSLKRKTSDLCTFLLFPPSATYSRPCFSPLVWRSS